MGTFLCTWQKCEEERLNPGHGLGLITKYHGFYGLDLSLLYSSTGAVGNNTETVTESLT